MTQTPEAPAALLRRAADRLRQLTSAIEPDVVFLFETGQATTVLQGGAKPADHVQPVRRVAQAVTPEIAAFIAAMHPGVATTLAAWLEEAAVDAEQIGPEPRALAVARQILGEA